MYIRVKVTPKSKREIFEQTGESEYHISLKEPAKNNLANTRILEILSLNLKTPIKNIRIINGHHSRSKLISINKNDND